MSHASIIAENKSPLQTVLSWLLRNHIWVFLALTVTVFSLASPYFLTVNNLGNILTQGAFIGILAIGMTMVMIDGEIDLSVGAILALASALAIGLQAHMGVWPAIFMGLVSGAALGFLNGTLVALSGMHSSIPVKTPSWCPTFPIPRSPRSILGRCR